MGRRDPKEVPAPPAAPAAPASAKAPERTSGRVKFDERGQAVWEWQLQTGHFDRNASSQRVKTLTKTGLSLEDTQKVTGKTPNKGSGFNPYESAPRAPKTPAPEKPGTNPYSQGPTRKPESVSYNPYERTDPKKPSR